MRRKKGQSVAEYAILITTIIAGIAMMQIYVKRGLQGKLADSSDQMVSGINDPTIWPANIYRERNLQFQYEPKELVKHMTQNILEDRVTYTMNKGGTLIREVSKTTTQNTLDFQEYDYNGPP